MGNVRSRGGGGFAGTGGCVAGVEPDIVDEYGEGSRAPTPGTIGVDPSASSAAAAADEYDAVVVGGDPELAGLVDGFAPLAPLAPCTAPPGAEGAGNGMGIVAVVGAFETPRLPTEGDGLAAGGTANGDVGDDLGGGGGATGGCCPVEADPDEGAGGGGGAAIVGDGLAMGGGITTLGDEPLAGLGVTATLGDGRAGGGGGITRAPPDSPIAGTASIDRSVDDCARCEAGPGCAGDTIVDSCRRDGVPDTTCEGAIAVDGTGSISLDGPASPFALAPDVPESPDMDGVILRAGGAGVAGGEVTGAGVAGGEVTGAGVAGGAATVGAMIDGTPTSGTVITGPTVVMSSSPSSSQPPSTSVVLAGRPGRVDTAVGERLPSSLPSLSGTPQIVPWRFCLVSRSDAVSLGSHPVHARSSPSMKTTPVLEFTVAREHAGTRLDRVAHSAWVEAFPSDGTSRSVLQRWIDEGRATVDGVVVTSAQKVKAGARVVVTAGPPPVSAAVPDASVPFEVLYADEHIVVVDKPAGIVVHPARSHPSGTLVNGLIARGWIAPIPVSFPSFRNDEGDLDDAADLTTTGADGTEAHADPIAHERPGIVHRIDKGTSGVLVVARTVVARERLKTLFATHDLEREYLAITVGPTVASTMQSLHGRHPRDRLRFTTRVSTGKHAVTHVSIAEHLRGATLVRCRLETGRTHQIRVHLTELAGTPILGDPLYGSPPSDPTLRALGDALGHQALHAAVLALAHPITGKLMRWTSPLPADMQLALDTLRAR